MPNGLGMGGQLEYFGFWLDSEFGLVRSAPSCTTFYSPQGIADARHIVLLLASLSLLLQGFVTYLHVHFLPVFRSLAFRRGATVKG